MKWQNKIQTIPKTAGEGHTGMTTRAGQRNKCTAEEVDTAGGNTQVQTIKVIRQDKRGNSK